MILMKSIDSEQISQSFYELDMYILLQLRQLEMTFFHDHIGKKAVQVLVKLLFVHLD